MFHLPRRASPALLFLSTDQGQGGRRHHSSEPNAPQQHQQAACSTRSTADICGGLPPPTGEKKNGNIPDLAKIFVSLID